MSQSEDKPNDADPPVEFEPADRVYWSLLLVLQAVMAIELVVLLMEQHWLSAFLVVCIMVTILAPALLAPALHVRIPAEFQLITVVFVFATLFLGEMLAYYDRFVWWDTVLHAGSGILLGIFGFLLVYVLNENKNVAFTLKPSFVALFAFLFAVAVGTLWEIFEFAMDELFDVGMQFNGLSDTMWDLIANTVSAAAICLFAWWYLRRGRHSFVENWVRKFVDRNPRLFRR